MAERLLLVRAVDDAAFEHPALARAAGAVAAAVGQADALADRGLQDRLVALDAEGLAARLDGDGERHGMGEGGAGASPRLGPRFCPAPASIRPACHSRPKPLRFAVPDRPTRVKRPVLLIVGCGDVGLRVARLLAGRWRVLGADVEPGARRRAARRAASCRCSATSTGRRRWRAWPASPTPCSTSRRRRRPARRPAHRAPARARWRARRACAASSTARPAASTATAPARASTRPAPLAAGHRARAPPRRRRSAPAPLRPRAAASP